MSPKFTLRGDNHPKHKAVVTTTRSNLEARQEKRTKGCGVKGCGEDGEEVKEKRRVAARSGGRGEKGRVAMF